MAMRRQVKLANFILKHPELEEPEICKALKQTPGVVKKDQWILAHAGIIPRRNKSSSFDKIQSAIDELERLLCRCELKRETARRRLNLSGSQFDRCIAAINLRRMARFEGINTQRFLDDWLDKENVEFRRKQRLNNNQREWKNHSEPGSFGIYLPADMYRRYLSIRKFKEKFGGVIPYAVMQDDELRRAWGIVD